MAHQEFTQEELQQLLDRTQIAGDLGVYVDIPFDYTPEISAKEIGEIDELIWSKRYNEAIHKGEELLHKYPNEGILQDRLAEAYFKGRKEILQYRSKCISYVKDALSNRVCNNGLLKRLVLELGKDRCYYQVKQLWDFLDKHKDLVITSIYPINWEYFKKKAQIAEKR